MRLLFLLTPVAMLAALWLLQRLEVWMSHPIGHNGRGSHRGAPRQAARRAPHQRQRGIDRA
jgi:hypothetical protein